MSRNIKFTISILRNEWLSVVLKVLQMLLAFILVGSMMCDIIECRKAVSNINRLIDKKESIGLSNDESTKYENILYEGYKQAELKQFVNKIFDLDNKVSIVNNINNKKIDRNMVELVQVTSDFFENYNIKTDVDDSEITKEFILHKIESENEAVVIPVIAGGNYNRKYKKGDVISDSEGYEYKIIGFAEKKQEYILPLQGKEMNSLDDSFICPIYVDMTDSSSMCEFVWSCQFVDLGNQKLNDLLDYNNKNQVLDFHIINYKNQMEYIKKDYVNGIALEGFFAICLFVFSLVGMISTMIIRVIDNAYEYSVNLLCGATMKDIYSRITYEFLFIICVGVFVSLCIYQLSIASICIVILAVVCYLFICFYLRRKVRFESLVNNLSK